MTKPEHEDSQPYLDPEDWVDAYGDRMFRFAKRRLRDPSEAEEVVQEAFLSAIKSESSYAGRGSQQGWLMSILRRKIIDRLRLRGRRVEESWGATSDPTQLLFDEQGSWRVGSMPNVEADATVEGKELQEIVLRCLESIPKHYADVFVLKIFDELEVDEISRELEISASNVWIRLHRARLGLAKCVGAKWFAMDDGTLPRETRMGQLKS